MEARYGMAADISLIRNDPGVLPALLRILYDSALETLAKDAAKDYEFRCKQSRGKLAFTLERIA